MSPKLIDFHSMKTSKIINMSKCSFCTFSHPSLWNQSVQLELVDQSTYTFYTVRYVLLYYLSEKLYEFMVSL